MASGKKKVSQSELRRLMNEHKNKLSKKIVSPVAKYTDSGQLTCTVCNTAVVSDRVWESHKSSKQHLDNVNLLKRQLEPPPKLHVWKRPNEVDAAQIPPHKKLRGILKNTCPQPVDVRPTVEKAPVVEDKTCPLCKIQVGPEDWALHLTSRDHLANSQLPDGDDLLSPNGDLLPSMPILVTENKRLSLKLRELEANLNVPDNLLDKSRLTSDPLMAVIKGEDGDWDKKGSAVEEVLPEGFFDDPMLDAKARNIEYKDPVEEEWEKFQKVMKEENTVSAQIIAEDQDEATVERQIDEIDEQMRNWSRVLDLERRKEELEKENACKERVDDGFSSAEETEFEEFLDWRVKKAFK